MALKAVILVNVLFIIFVLLSCIRGFPFDRELKGDEEFILSNRHLLSKKECNKYNSTFGQREPKDM